jgi:hypothetical protein
MKIQALQIFFAAFSIALATGRSDAAIGSARLNDVDGHTLSVADGHVTVLVLTSRANLPKAELVGDRVPDFCLGNPKYRMITLVEFGKQIAPIRGFLEGMTRRRLDNEAKELQKRYDAHKIDKNARADIFAVADFGGDASSQIAGETPDFAVLVFDPNGRLLKHWDDVPSADELAAALKM